MEEYLIVIAITVLVVYFGIFIFKKDQKKPEKNELPQQKLKKKSSISYGNIFIFYGSQSGTAIKLSNILNEEAQQNFFNGEVIDLINFNFEVFTTQPCLCIFAVATHGEGEPTDNAKGFFENLKQQQNPQLFKRMKFTVFGLGNTQYEHYNAMGRLLNKELERLGGKRVYKYGEGDDNSSLEDDFNEWKTNIWQELIKVSEVKEENEENQTVKQELRLSKKSQAKNVLKEQEGHQLKYQFQTEAFLKAQEHQVKEIKEIRQNNEQGSTLHLKIENLSKAKINYRTAQNVGVFCKNDHQLVNEVCAFLNENQDEIWVWEGKQEEKDKLPFPSGLTTKEILESYCDFQGQMMKKTLKDIAKICKNSQREDLVQKLELLASAQGKNQFQKEIFEQQKGIFDILKENNIKLSFQEFIQLCPRINPRLFTVSSSSVKYENELHITASLVKDQLPSGGFKEGLCSKYFTNLQIQIEQQKEYPNIRIDFRESSFKLPENRKKNIIMVGAGTGVAPFIGFCQEKQCLKEQFGNFILFFGCRKAKSDFIFEKEIHSYVENGVLNQFFTAFSRDQDKKIYVQDLIQQQQDLVYNELFINNAVFYICGSTSMGASVIQQLKKIISQKQGQSEEESNKIIQELEHSHQIIKELW